MSFIPAYLDNVTVTFMKGSSYETVYKISPIYCLDEASTKVLAEMLKEFNPVLSKAYPLVTGGPFNASMQVNMIQFSDSWGRTTDIMYAGQLASYWTHGFPNVYAMQMAINDIMGRMGF